MCKNLHCYYSLAFIKTYDQIAITGNDEKAEESSKPKSDTVQQSNAPDKLYKFPLGRIKNIMKLDPDVNLASQESVFLITKALEMFVENLAIESYSFTAQTKKKTISKKDVENAIDAVDALAFLDGAMDDWNI